MDKKNRRLTDLQKLHDRAEAVLVASEEEISILSPNECRRIVYELRTYQIELELQNDELRQSQQDLLAVHARVADLYDRAPVGYLTLSKKGVILESNLTFTTMSGVERCQLIEKPLSSIVVNEDQSTYYLFLREIFETKKEQRCELRIKTINAGFLWVQLESVYEEAREGESDRVRLSLIDICERKSAEEEKRTLMQQVQHRQKLESLGIMAGGIAHDFNNILALILGNTELALKTLSSSSPAWSFLQEVDDAAMRATVLVQQMLAYSGRGRFVVKLLDLSEAVNGIAHLLKSAISRKASLTTQLEKNLPTIKADPAHIQQIVMNLITNASEAIGEDRVGTITVSTGVETVSRESHEASCFHIVPAAGHYVFLEVVDTGCGMDNDTKERLFDPFFTTKFTGRGLGMSTVLGMVCGHNGAIMIESEVGKGTTFRVLFPAHAEQVAKPELADDRSGSENWRGTGTVLIVDDESAIRRLAAQMLAHLGFETLSAVDGQDGINVFRENADSITCVLLDLTMPRMDGGEAYHAMKRIQADVPIILSSGFDEIDITERFGESGIAGFIQKPYKLVKLREAVQRAIKTRERMRPGVGR
jgi:PAS domain S-box-containing protein